MRGQVREEVRQPRDEAAAGWFGPERLAEDGADQDRVGLQIDVAWQQITGDVGPPRVAVRPVEVGQREKQRETVDRDVGAGRGRGEDSSRADRWDGGLARLRSQFRRR
ncbi:hypothetical protein AB0H00_04705 [Nocardia sp. NPDC023852]|uniref:hypothetical protein n=1 Tax=Nocardia sp. NPDC023852 TaxID=3154697 RepID=UPI0033E0585D